LSAPANVLPDRSAGGVPGFNGLNGDRAGGGVPGFGGMPGMGGMGGGAGGIAALLAQLLQRAKGAGGLPFGLTPQQLTVPGAVLAAARGSRRPRSPHARVFAFG
jgi:hypothetical protein